MMQATIGRKARPEVDRRVAEVLLQVIGEEEEDGEDRDRRQGDDEVGAAAVAVEDDRERQQRVLDAALDDDEGDQERSTASANMTSVRPCGPALRLRRCERP